MQRIQLAFMDSDIFRLYIWKSKPGESPGGSKETDVNIDFWIFDVGILQNMNMVVGFSISKSSLNKESKLTYEKNWIGKDFLKDIWDEQE